MLERGAGLWVVIGTLGEKSNADGKLASTIPEAERFEASVNPHVRGTTSARGRGMLRRPPCLLPNASTPARRAASRRCSYA